MKQVVVDTSVIIAIITDEPPKNTLIRLTEGVSLVAPPSLNWEIGNALIKMLRRSTKTWTEVLTALQNYSQIPIFLLPIELNDALQIGNTLNKQLNYYPSPYAYDLYFIRCALQYQLPLITLDNHLAFVAKQMGVTVIEVRAPWQ